MERLTEQKVLKSFKNPPNKSDTAYALVRSPYTRLESFYKDKLIKAMSKEMNQSCQRAMAEIFGRERLVNQQVSFQEFILESFKRNLPHILEKKYYDSHFKTQSSFIPSPINHVIHIENLEEMDKLSDILGINLNEYQYNNTNDIEIALEWTSEMRELVNDFYRVDFERFGYPPTIS
jgi:hypothetical protein